MTERVVYCHRGFLGVLSGQAYTELGHLEDGIWASVGDEALLAIKDRYAALPLLYFSREEYEHAIRDLGSVEVSKIIRKRLDYWSATALDQDLYWLYLGERRSLTLAALGRVSGSLDVATVLDDHFEQTLRLMARMVGEGRYDDVSLAEMLVTVREGEARLLKEGMNAREVAGHRNNATEVERFAQAIETRKRYVQVFGTALEKLGHAGHGGSLPYIDLERVLFISPRDQELTGGLRVRHVPFAEWREGLVVPWRVRQIPDLEERGKSVVVLYFSKGEFLEDLQLTTAQLQREFKERMEDGRGSSVEALAEHLNALQLEHILLKHNTLRIARREDPQLVLLLEAQLVEEAEALKSALALHPSWLGDVPESGSEAISTLKRTEQELLQDARLFMELHRRAGTVEPQSRLASILQIKKKDVARLAELPGSGD